MRICWSCVLAVAACGGGHGSNPDAASDATPDAAFVEAMHGDVPQVVSGGGPVLATPTVVPIFFAGDSGAQAQLEVFLRELASSAYWTIATGEYGIDSIGIAPSVVTTAAPPTTDDALEAMLGAMFPDPDPGTIYAVFLPEGVTLTDGTSSASCSAFYGYHSEIAPASASAPPPPGNGMVYALLPRCTAPQFPGPLDVVTFATSHELIEATTDPHPFSAPAYVRIDPEHFAWGRTPGAEIGDMCEFVRAAFQPLVGGSYVQRVWSNRSAAAGHDPCVPVLDTPYLAASPVLSDLTITMRDGSQLVTEGITVNTGTPVTLEVDLFSDAPSGFFAVSAQDAAIYSGAQPSFSFGWDRTDGRNGDKLHLTVTRTVAGTGTRGGEIAIFVTSNGIVVSQWWIYVAGQ
ncbi:MAG TPA: hypothetical protein VLX92_20070 [Kofleriaceae bacterium]|nr:hypothetical protein [Kofleriaceae bacterium]